MSCSNSSRRSGNLDLSRPPSDILVDYSAPACRPTFRSKNEGSPVTYSETTRSIKITVKPFYLEDQSSPAENHYVWAYHVRIENRGEETVQLRRRHWKITDNRGQMQEVRGPGVVGEQPVLAPGESFEYTSGTPLPTPSGIMVGSYEMETRGGESFSVRIPAFSLDSPHQPVRLN
jgi:ApaG protein